MPEDLTRLAFLLHVAGGAIGLVSGIVAMTARKGGPVHRAAGNTFFVSMMVMAAFAVYLGFVRPGELVNVFIGVLVAYLVATAWVTIRRPAATVGLAEKIGLAVALALSAPFVLLSAELALGLPTFFHSALAFKGPVLLAIYLFTAVLAVAVGSDAIVVLSGGVSGAARIARHLWRLCVALTLATGSALSNGLPRLLPPVLQLPDWTLLLQFVWVGLLFFWIVRVRLTGWSRPWSLPSSRQETFTPSAKEAVRQSSAGV
jgi:uncharacterized membrane protein